MRCPSCSIELKEHSRPCPSCGWDAAGETAAIAAETSPGAASAVNNGSVRSALSVPSSGHRISTSALELDQQFAPGAIFAARYRIIGLLGKGGMGEVYRADDLTLGQAVALKFLPDKLAEDPQRLERFYDEVRLARQVSHLNVCRIYDIGKESGKHFLSMEYIDGEDLASLLRRIGRLPQDKGLEIARQLCAGLAAAHERGVLHRDLKPANVMIDGRGKVRIADFGLARAVEDIRDPKVLEGTPAYMAPEQFSGQGESVKSDLYSLGLVLYEIFTGKAAFKANTVSELVRLHRESNPANPSTIIAGMDPAIERVILRCLEKDPALRPSSALAISAALPGGDPLAAALAAGETPSPEMVAAAGDAEGLSLRSAWAALSCILIGILIVLLLADKASILSMIPQVKRPEALTERGQELIHKLGYSQPPLDSAYGYRDTDFLGHLRAKVPDASHWEQLKSGEPPVFVFWYRQSPRFLTQSDFQLGGRIERNSPPQIVPGMVCIQLDLAGPLMGFDAVPLRLADPSGGQEKPDWKAIFEEAGFDLSKFKQVPPRYSTPVYADLRMAWEGAYAQRNDIPIHVEAASAFGKLVYFQIFEPWGLPGVEQLQAGMGIKIADIVRAILLCGVIAGALFLAWRNLRLNHGDRRGAFRISMFVFLFELSSFVLQAHFVPDFYEISGLLFRLACRALMSGMLIWVGYIALEPHVRRWWPHTLISWARLLSGHFKDPKIGRDILVAGVGGVSMVLLNELSYLVPIRLRLPSSPAMGGDVEAAMGPLNFAGKLGLMTANVLITVLWLFLALFLLRLLLKRQWLAAAVLIVFLMAVNAGSSVNPVIGGLLGLIAAGTFVLLLLRFGLVAAMAFMIFNNISNIVPITADLSRWYASYSALVLLLAAGLAMYGFRNALAGKPAFNLDLLRE